MLRIKSTLLFLFFLSVLNPLTGFSQKTTVYTHQEADYKSALKSFENGHYSIAQKKFKGVYTKIESRHSELRRNSEYYHAVCALKLFNDDAELLFVQFIENYPQSPQIRLARFQLGRYYYRKNEWRKAMKWMGQVDVNELEEVDVPEYYFKLGYASYKVDEFSQAQKYFNEAKQLESIYQSSALFYYSFLSYKFNFNETALKGFEQLKDDENFGPVVPYYIIQIYYLQGKFDEITEFGPDLVENAIPKKQAEIARIVGEGFYRNNDYVKAVHYLEIFMDKGYYADSTSNYQMGYSYYKTKQFDKATPYFQKTSDMDTEIGQLSLYYLGDIYLKENNKNAARSAFRFASKSKFNQEIKENALFNYAKLSYELDIDPYHESIIALEKYMDEFPNSPRLIEARKYLLNVYLNTKNYQRAIVALDKIKNKDLDIQYAYQKIAYFRGIELFNSEKIGFDNADYSNYTAAIFYFQKSLDFPIDNKITALANYWRAEAYYRVGNMDKALKYFQVFKNTSESILLPEYQEVEYQIAYAHLGNNAYGPAIQSFRKYLDKHKGERSNKVNDAYLKTGDSYLVIKGQDDLLLSLKYYQKVIDLQIGKVDYAYFQIAQAYMLLSRYDEQAEALNALVASYPDSKYVDEAKYTLGETYLVSLQNFDKAIQYFTQVVEKHNGDVLLVQKSYNGLGTAYNNKGDYKKALSNFETSIALNPRTEEAFNAMLVHNSICVDNIGDAQRHIDFRSNIGLPEMSQSLKDSSVFLAAKKFYLEEDYPTAIKSLNNYLNAYPKALFVNTANYFLAESHLALKEYDQALIHYENVIEQPAGEYTERSVYYSAKINANNQNHSKAITRFLYLEEHSNYDNYILEAQIGLMRSYRVLGQSESCLKYTALVLSNEKTSNVVKIEAQLTAGLSYFDSYQYELALQAFEKTENLTKNESGAEAKYHIAYIQYLKENYEGSVNEVYDLAKNYPSYKTWVTKGFLLMSDNFVKQKDYFQAKYILKTVIENYEGEDLVVEAGRKLDQILAIEKAEEEVKVKEEEEIKIGEESEESELLYDNSSPKTDSIPVLELVPDTVPSSPLETTPDE